VLQRFLYTPAGRVRVGRMFGVVISCIVLAIFGSFLLVLTPALSDHEGLQTLWVLFSVFLLKFPLVCLLWWFIVRNKEWPVRPPKWSDDETREILTYLVAEADRSMALPDAPPRSYGRLVAHLKSAVLAGDGEAGAAWVLGELDGACDSPTSCYALAVAALVAGDDPLAAEAAAGMREGGEPFARASEALAALAAGDGPRYREAVGAIVADFEGRDAHLTGVPIADTAVLMEALAERRGMAARPVSPLMPASR
jgi:hypothetical protein